MSKTRTLTLAEFLTARLDEVEAVARAAQVGAADSGAWWVDGPAQVSGKYWVYATGEKFDSPDVAAHVALHDPSRVLAECEAKRRIVDLRREVIENGDYPQNMRLFYLRCLAHMALPYADHPDYRPEWRP